MYLIVVLPDKPEYYIEDFDDLEEREEIYEWQVVFILISRLFPLTQSFMTSEIGTAETFLMLVVTNIPSLFILKS